MLPEALGPDAFARAWLTREISGVADVDEAPQWTGAIALAGMTLLRSALHDDSGEAEVWLYCGTDDARRRRIAGRVRATLILQCQRCLEACYHPVDSRFEVVVVQDEEEGERLPEDMEPFVAAGAVRPLRVAEEELILCLPPVALHEPGMCEPPSNPTAATPEEKSPFAALKGLVDGTEDGSGNDSESDR